MRTTSQPSTATRSRLGWAATVALLTTAILPTAGLQPVQAQAAVVLDRWSPPETSVDPRFTTLPARWSDGAVSTSVIPASQLPLRMVVEQEVAAVLGTAAITEGLSAWNGIPGSRFEAVLVGTVDDRVRAPRIDGTNRIFLDDSCSGGELGWGYINQTEPENRYGMRGGYTVDADMGICRRLLDRPQDAASTVRHELGHLIGLGHVADGCRVMAEVAADCQTMAAAEHDAARYLYPQLPRLAGPTRFETAARAVYATSQVDGGASTVVLVDGDGPSELPVAAAALAGALDAPMLLANPTCSNSAMMAELRRVAAPLATVLVVGGGLVDCTAAVTTRGFRPVLLPTLADVAEEFPADTDTVFVVRGAMADGNLPDGLTAAAAAGGLGAPILMTQGDRLASWSREFLDQRRGIRRAVVVGGTQAVPVTIADLLSRLGISVERRGGADRIATALSIAETPGAFPTRGPVLVVSSQTWADAVAGSAIGAARGWPVLLTPNGQLDDRVARQLEQRATGGFVMGGRTAIHDTVLMAVNASVR